MSARKALPPPKGAEEARAAVLAGRFTHDQLGEDTAAAAAASDRVEKVEPPEAAPGVRAAVRAARASSRTPEGMTRKTYYLPQTAAAELAAAAERVRASTGGLVSKHQALAAIISAGIAQTDAVTAALRAELVSNLGEE